MWQKENGTSMRAKRAKKKVSTKVEMYANGLWLDLLTLSLVLVLRSALLWIFYHSLFGSKIPSEANCATYNFLWLDLMANAKGSRLHENTQIKGVRERGIELWQW